MGDDVCSVAFGHLVLLLTRVMNIFILQYICQFVSFKLNLVHYNLLCQYAYIVQSIDEHMCMHCKRVTQLPIHGINTAIPLGPIHTFG